MTKQHPNGAKPPYFITTAIPYVNARPHIGHALEFVLTDALARYHRRNGEDVRFLTGTDENSLKNVQAAEREGVSTQALVDRNAAYFYALRDLLHLSFDDFIRTSAEARHLDGVRKLWQACEQNGDIYRRSYQGLYCVGCEQFYTAEELIDGLCPEHRLPPELIAEENYFFRLSRYTDPLSALIESGQLRIVPDTRKNEVLSFIHAGLHDFSISRSRARAHGWGIPVPHDPGQVMYVWFDALGNYITALNYAQEDDLYRRYWQDNPCRVHVIGKGITRFHAVYWPAMLLSAGVRLPTTIFIHGYITLAGEKVSKSLGNAIDPVAVAQQYGAEALRYYLLREIKATEDGDFTWERFVRAYNANLADQLGNLLSRVVGMVTRYYDGLVPAPGPTEAIDQLLLNAAQTLPERVDTAIARFALHEALAAIWDLIAVANKYIVEVQPWVLAKQRRQDPTIEARLATTLYNLAETLRLVADYCHPFLPATGEKIARQLGLALEPNGDWAEVSIWGRYPAGTMVQPDGVLFPKLALPEK
ncbi:MAG: methionine--tRNA ligase [Anaerolineae bacterium]|nr:methionine--tRNA ligase [Anaerolineae bacterium]